MDMILAYSLVSSGTSLGLKVASLFFGVGIIMVLVSKIGGLKKFGWSSLLYVFLTSVLLALPGLFLFWLDDSYRLVILICTQVFIMLIGIIHVKIARALLKWYLGQPFLSQIFFVVAILLFSFLFYRIIFDKLTNPGYFAIWFFSLLWFFIPLLLHKAILILSGLPGREYKKWYYPVDATIEDPTDEELKNPVVISFVFHKNEESADATTFRAKAPIGMELGRLFYFFINDYNSRHPQEPISFIDDDNKSSPWIFLKLKSSLFGLKRAVDPQESVYANHIRENDILICKRVV